MEEVNGGRKSADFYRAVVLKGNGPGQKLEEEQKRREETEKERSRREGTKAEKIELVMIFGVAEEATIVSAGDNRSRSGPELLCM